MAHLNRFTSDSTPRTGEEMALYLTQVLDRNDPALLASVLGQLARTEGMSKVAESAGMARESLYKALRPESTPRFDTVNRVFHALGVRLVVEPIDTPSSRYAEAARQTRAIFALEGMSPTDQSQGIDAAIQAGSVTLEQAQKELLAYVKEHKTSQGFIESRPWAAG